MDKEQAKSVLIDFLEKTMATGVIKSLQTIDAVRLAIDAFMENKVKDENKK
jgi:hypothetical protein